MHPLVFNLTFHDENNYEIKHFYFPSSCFDFKLSRRTKGLFRVQMISIFMCFRISTRLVVNQLGHEQNLLIVPNTACLTSLILQQYKNGFKDELR